MKVWQPRFTNKIDFAGPNECWVWTGAKDRLSYGRFGIASGTLLAHRVAYVLTHGPIPDGKEIDHRCRNPSCVNPHHLTAITHQENIKRGIRFWEKCPHGDIYRNPQNRTCQRCANVRRRANRKRNK